MQLIWNHKYDIQTDLQINCGTILPSKKSLYIANPLQYHSYDPFSQRIQLQQPRQSTLLMKPSSNERFIALASDIIDLLDVERGKIVRQFTDHTNIITGITSPENSSHIWATVGADKTLRILDSRKHPGQIFGKRFDYKYQTICYAPDNNIICCGGDNINIFDLRTMNTIGIIKSDNQILDIKCHPEECIVLGCTDDKMVKIWDICSLECLCQSFPLDSSIKKVLFDPIGKTMLAFTKSQIYIAEHETFNIINQINYSNFKITNNFLIMDGETLQDPKELSSNYEISNNCDTLDAIFDNDNLLHFGYFYEKNAIELRTITLKDLFTPSKEIPSLPINSSRLNEQEQNIERDLCPPSRLSLNSPEVESIASSDVSPMLAEPPPFIPPIPDQTFVVRKLPRSTSSSRSLKTPQMNRRSNTPIMKENSTTKGRSSSTHSLHSSVKRVNSNDKAKLHNEQSTSIKSKTSTQRLISKNTVKPPIYPGRNEKTVIEKSKNKNGLIDSDNFMNSHKSTLDMIASRKTGIKRIKATMKARNANEDEVLDEASHLLDKTVLAHLLNKYTKTKSLRFASRVLPELRMLLSNPNSDVVDIALDMLHEISTTLLPIIKQGISSNAQTIGVDVAAEQRQMWSLKCKECLTELYVNNHFILTKLTEEQQLKFNSSVERFESLCT